MTIGGFYMYRQKKLTDLSEFERLKNFKRPVSVFQSFEFINEIIIKDIVPFETEIEGQLINEIIIIAEETEERYVMSNCTFYYV